MLSQLVKDIDAIYDCKSRKTAKKRLAKVLAQREVLEREHPEAVGILDTLEKRFPLVVNSLIVGTSPRRTTSPKERPRRFTGTISTSRGWSRWKRLVSNCVCSGTSIG